MDRGNQVIRVLSAERFTPFALARKRNAVAMLESATFEGGRARYSLLLVKQAFRIQPSNVWTFTPDACKSALSFFSLAEQVMQMVSSLNQDIVRAVKGFGHLSQVVCWKNVSGIVSTSLS